MFVYTCGSSYINLLNMAWFHVLSPFLSGITLPAYCHTSCLLLHFLPAVAVPACHHTSCLVYVHLHVIYHSVIMVSERLSSSLDVRSWDTVSHTAKSNKLCFSELFIRNEYRNKRFLSHTVLYVCTHVRTYVCPYVHVRTYIIRIIVCLCMYSYD